MYNYNVFNILYKWLEDRYCDIDDRISISSNNRDSIRLFWYRYRIVIMLSVRESDIIVNLGLGDPFWAGSVCDSVFDVSGQLNFKDQSIIIEMPLCNRTFFDDLGLLCDRMFGLCARVFVFE